MIVLCFLMLGSFLHVPLVWELADLFNGLMVIPNVIALIGLSKIVGRVLDDYESNFLKGHQPPYGALSAGGAEPRPVRFATARAGIRVSTSTRSAFTNRSAAIVMKALPVRVSSHANT